MSIVGRFCRSLLLSCLFFACLASSLVYAADSNPRHKKVPKPGEFNPDNETVEMFRAIDSGQIKVQLIPKNSKQSRVRITNKTDQPLNVQLPNAFAGVPVLAQGGFGGGFGGAGGGFGGAGGGFGGGGGRRGGGRPGGGGGGGGGSQGVGGGMGGMGGGMFNVAPEVVADFKVPTVCLEHGKGEPKPKIPYEIKPIEEFTDRADVHELCSMVGYGQINQRAAQAAAWFLNNDMSWQELAAKQTEHANGTSTPYFSQQEIQAAMQIAAEAKNLAEEKAKTQQKQSEQKVESLSRQQNY